MRTPKLPVQLQTEANGSLLDSLTTGIHNAGCLHERATADRRSADRMMRSVGDVEHVSPKFQAKSLSDSKLTFDIQICINETRTLQAVCAASSEATCRRRGEVRHVVPFI